MLLKGIMLIPLSKPESLGISSQNSKAPNIRLLSDNEENRIIDSSLDFKDSISTQALLEKEPDTVVIKESDDVNTNNDQEGNQDEEDTKSSEPFKNFKLPDGDSPWLSKIKDPFNDQDSPWLSKMKDPFKETPINTKVFDAFNETPNSNKRSPNPLNTPTAAAHKVFQRLRENNNIPELDIDSQSLPAMFKDTQPISENPTQEEQEENIHFNETTINDSTMNDDITHGGHDDDDDDNKYLTKDDTTTEIEPTKRDVTSQILPTTQVLDDTVPIDDNNQDTNLKSDNTQGDIQVPGTAPDDDASIDVEESAIMDEPKDAHFINNQEDRSSPINSDAEDETFPLNIGRRLQSEPVGANYLNILAEDSIQKYHRDLGKKVNELPTDDGKSLLHSKSFTNDTLQISQGKRLNSLPLKLDNNKIQINHNELTAVPEKQTQTVINSSNGQSKSQPTSSLRVEESSPAIRDEDLYEFKKKKKPSQIDDQKDTVDINGLAENVTQEFSDVDDVDDESKIENSLVEERSNIHDLENTDSSNRIRRSSRNKNKKIDYTSSPEKSFNQEDLSVVLDADTSQLGNDDHETSDDDDRETPDLSSKLEFPNEILREENHELTENDIIFKNSIWSLDNTRYYPGLIIGLSENALSVKFFESTNEVTGSIFPLDIQVGDHVKVERGSYIVTGLECVINDNEKDVIRCMRGYDTVLLKKLKGKGKRQKILDNEIRVPLEEVRIENEDWHLRSRVLGEEQMIKPKRFSAKDSKTRKRLLPISYNEDDLLSSAPVKRPKSRSPGIFDECVFVITGEVDKDSLTEKIESNGGFILEEGFAAQISFSNGEPTSKFFENFKFAALITNKPFRSSKFLETVALGWPLLFQEFIEDCIFQNKLKENIYSYALPCGESTRFGCLKSANFFLFIQKWDSGYNLSSQLDNNKFLKDKVVFLCSKKNEDITKFMFQILGSSEVVLLPITNYTNFVNKASQYSNSTKILVYHDKISVIKSTLSSEKPKKSRKGSILSQIVPSNQERTLDLVDWEWLVQCIISGDILESKEQCKI
ncbi:DNA repair protein [Wickerhamomyces ciferrii]|uniref:DNA repair protein n=1 Tax=Wickerhamomyces ciferrii (strain ATCC 14091 / BCRC 22168 / CBS 111 / JCM 3599 / NBRC 0793 / NRRL Y-1031 F-60-10) TaxID=1206466 RepID=K0KKY1_WICCF|nr:DNA repair protein [Wickerhamomyces ciferrii]CCH42802.1 DNA repair protein [Wickerhamomyces ciferrii]